ncbi:MAG: response regulator transcription factor [Bacteroidales bacterium]|nr:response regulator transcription factor [Bacteroidales bacterium]MCF8454529.1 response regulator transcription factor [Bacteroidales bacterium]
MTKILLVEDDENLGSLLQEYLKAKNYNADWAKDGEKGYKAFMNQNYDVCILDIMMPYKDGLSLAKDIRSINSEIPIIFLSAKSMQEDVIEGFRAGGDDYMKKPFSMEELLFRIDALIRRSNKHKENQPEIFHLGKFLFDPNKRTLMHNDAVTKLTTKESELLKLLCENRNEVLERNYALQKIWRDDTYFNARSMDVYITKLRKLLSSEPTIEIINVHGKGFKLII